MGADVQLQDKDLHAVRRMRGYPCADTIKEAQVFWPAVIIGGAVIGTSTAASLLTDSEAALLPAFFVSILWLPYVINRLVRNVWYRVAVPWAYKDLSRPRRIALILAVPVFVAALGFILRCIPMGEPGPTILGPLFEGAPFVIP